MSFFKKIFFKIEILFLCHLLVRTTTQPHNNPHDNTPGQQQTRTTTHPHNNMPTYHKQQPVRCRYLMTPVCSANGAGKPAVGRWPRGPAAGRALVLTNVPGEGDCVVAAWQLGRAEGKRSALQRG